jgi:hypothetical protein
LILLQHLQRFGAGGLEKPKIHRGQWLVSVHAIAFLHVEVCHEALSVVFNVNDAMRLDRPRRCNCREQIPSLDLYRG